MLRLLSVSILLSVPAYVSASALGAHARGEPIARLPTSCPDGEYLTDTACLPCPEGYFCVSSEPQPCPAGTTAPAGSFECTPCPNGYICNAFRTLPALVPRQSSTRRRDTAPPAKRDGAVYPRQSPMKREAAPPSKRDTSLYPRQSPMKRDTALYARQSPMKRDTSSPPSKRDAGIYPRQSPMKRDTAPPSTRDSGIYPRQSPMKRDASPPPSKRDSGIYPRQSPMKRDTALLPRQSGSARRDTASDSRQNRPTKRSLPIDEPLVVYGPSSELDEPVVQREEEPASAPLEKRGDGTCVHRGEISCPSALGHGFDCINPMSDLESCGGCVVPGDFGHGDGVDCTALEGVDNVQCVRGTCLISSCGRGYKFSHNGLGCVRLEGDPRNLLIAV